MRIRIGKKGIIAACIAGSVLLCGALFKMTMDSGVINNHEVAHVGTQHSGLSDAVKDLLDGNQQGQNNVVDVDANADAAVLAGVTMSEDETDANQAAPVATAETTVQEKAEEADPAPTQETVVTPATEVVEEAAPVEQEEVVESVRTFTVSTPVTKEIVTTVDVPVEETVVEVVQTQSFKGALGGSAGVGADKAMQSIVTPEFADDGVNSDEKLGEGDFIIFD